MKRFLIILLLYALFFRCYCYSNSLAKNTAMRIKRNSCTPKVRLENCKPGVNKRYTYYLYDQTTTIEMGCPKNNIEQVKWSATFNKKTTDLHKYQNKNTMIIAPGDFSEGNYVLSVKVKERNGNWGSASCSLQFITEPPIIIYKEGPVQYVVAGGKFAVDISESKNYGSTALRPKWLTNCTNKNTFLCKNTVCDLKPVGLRYEGVFDKCFEKLNFTAVVKHDNEDVKSLSHNIFFKNIVEKVLKFNCLKNCDGKGIGLTNPEITTAVELVCTSNCLGFKLTTPNWTLSDEHISYTPASGTYTIIDKFKMIIKENMLQYDTLYSLRGIVGGVTTTYFQFKTSPKFEKPQCDINPKIGISLETKFKITCKTTGSLAKTPPFYQVLQEKAGGSDDLLVAESAYNEFEVVLAAIKGSPTQRLLLTGHDMHFNKFNGDIPKVTVKERKITEDVALKELERINKLFADGNVNKAMQYTNGLIIEIQNDQNITPAFKRNTFNKLIESMTKVNVESIYTYRMMVSLLPTFYNSKNQDDTSKKKLVSLCKKMASNQVNYLLKSKYATAFEKEAKESSKHTQLCVNEMLKATPPTPPPPTTTVASSSQQKIDSDGITENYPDYDIPSTPKEQEIVQGAIDTIYSSAKGVAETLAPGENYHAKESNFETKVVKERVPEMQTKEVVVEGSSVKISAVVNVNTNLTMTTVLSSFQNGLLDSQTNKIATNIVDVNIYTEENQKVNDKVSFNLTMDKIKKEEMVIIYETVTVPADESTWNDIDIDFAMNVHRLPMMAHKKIVALFHKMKNTDVISVTVTVNRRPHLDDFRKLLYTVNGTDSTSYLVEHKQETLSTDSFVYFAILPHSDMLKGSGEISLPYHVQFSEQQCVMYDRELQKWDNAPCQVHSLRGKDENENDKIKCVCSHLTLFGAIIDNTDSKLDKVIVVEFESVKFINYIIFIHVAIIFCCYCIALCFIILRKREMGMDRIFFLSDNLKNDRYAYAVIVRTGTLQNAGTSSNVVIKVLGEISDSKPHVLNYPDPEMRILQADQTDIFILCTAKYLGKIRSIQLWFDSIGLRPNWYCDKVILIDLQSKAEWYFSVEQWLNVIKMNNKVKVQPSESAAVNKQTNLIIRKSFRFHAGGENTWNIFTKQQDHQLTYSQRITIILSMIYTTYTINVFLLQTPEMLMSDVYGYGTFKFDSDIITFSIVSGIVSSIINMPFVFFFRNSINLNKKYSIIQQHTMFSRKCRIYTWIFLCIWIFICMMYLVLFGFWVTLHTSYLWLIVIVVCILISALIMENIYIIVMSILSKRYFKKQEISYYNIPIILLEIEKQRKILFKKFGELLLRPYFTKHYHELRGLAAKNARLQQLLRIKVSNRFKDLCIFLFYIILLYIITLVYSDRLLHYSNREIRNLFAEGTFGHKSLDDVQSVDSTYEYIEETIIAIMHADHWYGGYQTADAGLMVDFNTKIMGVVQLRQQRRQQVCVPPGRLVELKIPCNNSAPIFDQWEYDNGSMNTDTLGQFKIYSSEGYTITLGRTSQNSNLILKYLRDSKWLDINTAVLFIEFWTYSTNANIFNIVQVIIERGKTGAILSSLNVFTARFLHINAALEYFIICCMITILILVLTMFTKNIILFVKNRSLYRQSGWNIFDSLLLSLSTVYIILYFLVNKAIRNLLEKLANSNSRDFVHYFHLAALSYGNIMVAAVLLCMATVRLWKFFRFGKVFQLMERTLYKSTIPILITVVYHWTMIMIFGMYAFVRFGAILKEFSNYIFTLTALSLASSTFNAQINFSNFVIFGNIIYIWYTIFMVLAQVFSTFYMAILMQGYEYSSNYFSNLPKTYSVGNYMEDHGKYYTAVIKNQYRNMRLRGGYEEYVDEYVHPKGIAEFYTNCCFIPHQKLRLLQNIGLSVCRNKDKYDAITTKETKLSKAEYETMARIYLDLSVLDKNDTTYLFFHATDPLYNTIKFIDYNRLLQMEFITKMLLHGEDSNVPISDTYIMHVSVNTDKLDLIKQRIDLITQVVNNIKMVKIK